jgi:hypothetical protein
MAQILAAPEVRRNAWSQVRDFRNRTSRSAGRQGIAAGGDVDEQRAPE